MVVYKDHTKMHGQQNTKFIRHCLFPYYGMFWGLLLCLVHTSFRGFWDEMEERKQNYREICFWTFRMIVRVLINENEQTNKQTLEDSSLLRPVN